MQVGLLIMLIASFPLLGLFDFTRSFGFGGFLQLLRAYLHWSIFGVAGLAQAFVAWNHLSLRDIIGGLLAWVVSDLSLEYMHLVWLFYVLGWILVC